METVREILEKLGVDEIEGKLEILGRYREEILKWNKKVNITTITNQLEFEIKHYADSLVLGGEKNFLESKKIVDIGTGGGFPGVPLAVAFPEKSFLLVDSLGKRVKIVDQVCKEIGIANVTMIHGRAEDLGQEIKYREKFDMAVSRAVANISVLSEYCLPLVRIGGWFVAYKGANLEEELALGEKAIGILGGGEVTRNLLTEYSNVPGYELNHCLMTIKKIAKTPKAYPRKAGTPSKNPLK